MRENHQKLSENCLGHFIWVGFSHGYRIRKVGVIKVPRGCGWDCRHSTSTGADMDVTRDWTWIHHLLRQPRHGHDNRFAFRSSHKFLRWTKNIRERADRKHSIQSFPPTPQINLVSILQIEEMYSVPESFLEIEVRNPQTRGVYFYSMSISPLFW